MIDIEARARIAILEAETNPMNPTALRSESIDLFALELDAAQCLADTLYSEDQTIESTEVFQEHGKTCLRVVYVEDQEEDEETFAVVWHQDEAMMEMWCQLEQL